MCSEGLRASDASRAARGSSRQERWQLVAESHEAARLGDNHRYTGTGPGLQDGDEPAERLLGAIEHAEVVERAPATGPRRRHRHTFTHGAERFDEVGPAVGAERVGESVGPDDDGSLPGARSRTCGKSRLEDLLKPPPGSEQRRRASRRDTGNSLQGRSEQRRSERCVGKPGCGRSLQLRPAQPRGAGPWRTSQPA